VLAYDVVVERHAHVVARLLEREQDAATAPELEGRGGLYLEDCHVAAVNDAPDAGDGVKSYALDPENAERLWQVSEQLIGERFPLAS